MMRAFMADDHHVVRQGLREILGRRPDLEVVAEAADGMRAEELARSTLAELLVLDIGLPLRRGLAVLERLRADGILLPVVFFSMYPAAQYAGVAKKAGAQGFVGKEANDVELLQALDQVLAGGTSFGTGGAMRSQAQPVVAPFQALSGREQQVCKALLNGTSLKDLSQRMALSTKTLSTYRTRLLAKLALRSNAELVALAICHGYR
jgi:two-component system, NarL family, invasion response regulator UvrY